MKKNIFILLTILCCYLCNAQSDREKRKIIGFWKTVNFSNTNFFDFDLMKNKVVFFGKYLDNSPEEIENLKKQVMSLDLPSYYFFYDDDIIVSVTKEKISVGKYKINDSAKSTFYLRLTNRDADVDNDFAAKVNLVNPKELVLESIPTDSEKEFYELLGENYGKTIIKLQFLNTNQIEALKEEKWYNKIEEEKVEEEKRFYKKAQGILKQTYINK